MKNQTKNYLKTKSLSFLAGGINGLFGTGGGSLAPAALSQNGQAVPQEQVTLFVLPLALLSGCIYRTPTEPRILFFACAGAAVGGIAGAFICNKVSSKILRLCFGVMIVITGVWQLL